MTARRPNSAWGGQILSVSFITLQMKNIQEFLETITKIK